MCFRIMLYFLSIYCLVLFGIGGADGSAVRSKRSDTDTSSDNSRSFQDMFNAFMSSLFGPNKDKNMTEATETPLNDQNRSSAVTEEAHNTPVNDQNSSFTVTGQATDISVNGQNSSSSVTKQAADTTVNDENDTGQAVLSNASQSLPTMKANITETNLESKQQEVMSENIGTQAATNTASSPEMPTSSTSSNPVSVSTLTSIWDTVSTTASRTESSSCYYDTHLRYYCILPDNMTDVSFSDVYSLFFSDAVIDALITACPRGTWCLQDGNGEWDSLIQDKVNATTRTLMAIDICRPGIQSCILNMINTFVGCSKYSRMHFTMETLELVCGLKEDIYLTQSCYKHVISALHVSLADILRGDVNVENKTETCKSPEAYMTKSLICLEVACPKQSKRFHSFTPWAWFTSVQDDLMIECKLNPTVCEAPLQSTTTSTNNETNLQTQQQEVTSQEKVTTSTTVSSTTPTTSTYYSSTSTDSAESATYPPEDDRCYTDAVFQNFCPVPEDMTDVSFWDLYSVFFSDTVLDALMIGCSKGSWCLRDRFDYWDALIAERVDMAMNSEIAASMCNPTFQPCIARVVNSFANCSMYSQMVFTSEVIKLACGLRLNTELTSTCFKHVLSALHVTLADILRGGEKEDKSSDLCESPEANMTQGLICVENSCPGESETFHSFKPWAWFTSVVNDLIVKCNYDTAKCMALLQPPPGYLYGDEMGTVVGISVATMITALTLTVVVCTCYKRHRRNAVVKEGYQRLLTDGDES